MTTVVRVDGFRIVVYGPPREHPPPHVHVECGAAGLVVIRLGSGENPPKVWAVYDMKDRDVVRAYRLVEQHHEMILEVWRRMHG